jgi:hypothetical protein
MLFELCIVDLHFTRISNFSSDVMCLLLYSDCIVVFIHFNNNNIIRMFIVHSWAVATAYSEMFTSDSPPCCYCELLRLNRFLLLFCKVLLKWF